MNLFALTPAEKNKRLKFRCVHRHNGLTGHPNCYDQFHGLVERVGFYDIESSQLNASFGIILSYCILGEDGVLYKRLLTPDEIRSGVFDYNLCEQFCKDVRNFDRIIGYYSEKFDGPMLRTRCIRHKLDFPVFKEIKHTDAWRVVRAKMRMHSNRMGTVCDFLGIPSKTHPLLPDVWIRCLSGDQDSLDFVMKHNVEDVESLKALWHRIVDYTQLTKTSI